MENRKDNYTPRERIDDSLLLEILRENTNSCVDYGKRDSYVPSRNGGGRSGCCERRRNNSSKYNCAENVARAVESLEHSYDGCNRRSDSKERYVPVPVRTSEVCARSINYKSDCNSDSSCRRYARREDMNEQGCSSCGKCISDSCVNNYPPAMVYCPEHEFDDLYEYEEALQRGTLFRVLDLPFYGSKCNNCK